MALTLFKTIKAKNAVPKMHFKQWLGLNAVSKRHTNLYATTSMIKTKKNYKLDYRIHSL